MPSRSRVIDPAGNMFRTIFGTGVATGIAVGLIISVLHAVTTTPLILKAEEFESSPPKAAAAAVSAPAVTPASVRTAAFRPARFVAAGTADFDASAAAVVPVHDDGTDHAHPHGVLQGDRLAHESHGNGHAGEQAAWAPADGLERALYSVLVNVLVCTGFGLMLVAAFALYGKAVTPRTGIVWGGAGFVIFTLSPALGLPPELPGTLAADLDARQIWWLSTVAATAGALWLMLFGRTALLTGAGVVLLALPHIVGAPHPHAIGGVVPPELAAQFAATAIAVNAVMWAMLGWTAAALYRRWQGEGETTA